MRPLRPDSSLQPLLARAALLCIAPLLLVCSLTESNQGPLAPVGKIVLDKKGGRVDQVVVLSTGQIAVRDAEFANERKQTLELYESSGRFLRKIGGFGRGPGQYYRLKTVVEASNQILWVADVANRITRFEPNGKVKGTKLVLNPGFQVHDLALDETRKTYYLTGCLPDNVYLDLGCSLVHQYDLASGKYRRSFLKTDPESLSKRLLSLQDILIDLDAQGRIYAVDAPIFKVVRIDPASGEARTFPLTSKILKPAPTLEPGKGVDKILKAFDESYLIDRVMTVGPSVLVSVRKPHTEGYLLFILDQNGRQIAGDIPAPGRLVGKSRAGNPYFVRKSDQRSFEITEYRLLPVGRPATRGK